MSVSTFAYPMRKILLPLLALCWPTYVALADDQEIPTLRICPEDVVQISIQEWRMGTNQVTVRWTYTEVGAKKALAFWAAHAGQKTRTAVGSYVSPPGVSQREDPARYAQWKKGWLKSRTDKFYGVSQEDAKAIVGGLGQTPAAEQPRSKPPTGFYSLGDPVRLTVQLDANGSYEARSDRSSQRGTWKWDEQQRELLLTPRSGNLPFALRRLRVDRDDPDGLQCIPVPPVTAGAGALDYLRLKRQKN
jgi:hypothetical protein